MKARRPKKYSLIHRKKPRDNKTVHGKVEISRRDMELLCEKFKDGDELSAAIKRLEAREPLAYVLGEWYFYGETYTVSPDCLIPRQDTEHLVDKAISLLPPDGKFADLCTGSGCIAISTLVHRPDTRAVCVDISEGALAIASRNARENGVSERLEFRLGDVLSDDVLSSEMYDIILSNPPYIASEVIDTLEEEVRREPRIALDGGDDGLVFYRRLISTYLKHVKQGGYLIMEIGYDQGAKLRELCDCEIYKDYGGNDRVAIVKA